MSEGAELVKRVAASALKSSDSLVAQWLPGGKRDGHEWVALNPRRTDRSPGSFRINLNTGVWADFAIDAKGGDLVSLYAYLHNLGQMAAAIEVGKQVGIDLERERERAAARPTKRKNQVWEPVVPAVDAAPFRLTHHHYGEPVRRWAYHDTAGALIGYVCRFDKKDGGKEILPAVWAKNDAGERAWRWLSFPKPRPLYGLPELAAKPAAQVLVVEGEKTADAARTLFEQLAVITWPGGSKAVNKTDWSALEGRDVIVWPDNDDAGTGAAQAVSAQVSAIARRVRIVFPPEDKPAGWDLADLDPCAASWAHEYLRAHLAEAEKKTPSAAVGDAPSQGWKSRLLRTEGGMALPTRHNVFTMLMNHPDVAGLLGYDEFAQRVMKMRETPWGAPPGEEWTAADDFQLGMWLAHGSGHRIIIGSDEPITSAVNAAALEYRFHPVRRYLEQLPPWDRVPRLGHWLDDCLGITPGEYAALVGTFFLINLVRRIFEPGCIMRSVPVLEGMQNKGKSTALRKLTEPWFADTPLDLTNKDSLHALRGVWLYEIAEFDSFNKVEVTRVKAFISSTSDHYRPPYEKRFVSVPRQTCFAASVNGTEYLKDPTGNTRFWPLETGDISLARVEEMRDALWAEALARYRERAPSHPTWVQEQRIFRPEQERREVMDPWWPLIARYVDGRKRVTMNDIFTDCLGVDPSRMDNAKQMSMRIGAAMQRLGWEKHREPTGSREYYYAPGPGVEHAQPVMAPAAASEGGDVPF